MASRIYSTQVDGIYRGTQSDDKNRWQSYRSFTVYLKYDATIFYTDVKDKKVTCGVRGVNGQKWVSFTL